MTLDELRAKLLFHNSMDIWITLCREKGWNRRDYGKYKKFVTHLRDKGVIISKAAQGHPIKDLSREGIETFTVKLDATTIEKIRLFS